MEVRNFWIEAQIDGRTTELTGGPQNKEGGFTLRIKQRDNGSISQPVRIEGFAQADGTLKLVVFGDGERVFEYDTKR